MSEEEKLADQQKAVVAAADILLEAIHVNSIKSYIAFSALITLTLEFYNKSGLSTELRDELIALHHKCGQELNGTVSVYEKKVMRGG